MDGKTIDHDHVVEGWAAENSVDKGQSVLLVRLRLVHRSGATIAKGRDVVAIADGDHLIPEGRVEVEHDPDGAATGVDSRYHEFCPDRFCNGAIEEDSFECDVGGVMFDGEHEALDVAGAVGQQNIGIAGVNGVAFSKAIVDDELVGGGGSHRQGSVIEKEPSTTADG